MKLNVFSKSMLLFLVVLSSLSVLNAAAPLLDVQVSETIQENVVYNPLGSTSGTFADAGENYSSYTATGVINVTNIHGSQSAQDIVLNFTEISGIYNITFSSGNTGYIPDLNIGGNYVILTIPDLGAGESSIFTYDVNTTSIAPAVNLTASYSDSRVFAGTTNTITDSLVNVLDAGQYPNNCVYNISLIHNAMTIDNSGTPLNVTFVPASLAGTDVANTVQSGDNRQINWTVRANGCLNATQTTDINYEIQTPTGIDVAQNYNVVNTTLSYVFDDTFSRLDLASSQAVVDLDLEFEKYLNQTLTGDNGTWQISAQASNPSDVDVNLTTVSLWVSQRNATGTGFTNPSSIDQDTISGANLTTSYSPNVLINSTSGNWNNTGSNWFFNYTFSASPIVWMDLEGVVINDGLQLQNRSVSNNENTVYVKELYLATGYWLQISRNITRLSNNTYNVVIKVVNLGSSPTPTNQAVQVFNFLPNTFTNTSPFVFSTSSWYTTSSASEVLNDPIYNGTMYQFGILENNGINSSLDLYGGSENQNNTWTVTYNVTGAGEFKFDDLFLTGVDPLNVEDFGGSEPVKVEGDISFMGAKVEYILGVVAAILGVITLVM